ncbi:MAG: hypothetical protein CMB56_005370 [Methanobacteriota archaeon]|nr:MAG: hypothetical protein CMB56_005370 [Euryarchaeota archaeon]|tara:strand:- start:2360 stop:3121 length:762 start_codon:yes stop_codon:yes gene_type:complete
MLGNKITELNPVPELTILQTQLGEWDNLNHVIICNSTNEAILIDPFSGEFWSNVLMDRNLNKIIIILTHSHWDHTRGVEKFLESNPNTEIYIHELEYKRGWSGPDTHRWNHQPYSFIDLNYGNLNFEIHCTPGHTPGHITLIGHGIIISGDCLFLGRCGRTDLFGGDKYSMWKSLMYLNKKLKKLPKDWLVFPGHKYPLDDNTNPDYLNLEHVFENNLAIKKQSYDDFCKLDYLEFDDALAKKSRILKEENRL